MAKKKKKKELRTPDRQRAAEAALPSGPSLRYQILISVFILIAAICALYPELVFEDKLFVAGDVESALSLSRPIEEGLEAGEYPQWNPYLFAGMPSYGSMSYVPYVYPVTVFTGFLITNLKFPNFTWLLFHVFLLGLGVWLILIDRGVHFLIAAGAGVLMMWMPNHVAVGVNGHGSQASAVGYIPFALFFWDRLWRGKGVALNASVLVILLGFQFLRSHLQISYYTFALIGIHFIFFGILRIKDAYAGKIAGPPVFGFLRAAYEKSTKRGAWMDVGGTAGVLALIVVGALGISAVLFLPVHDYAQYSIRGASSESGLTYQYATSWSLHPLEALTFVIPYSFGFGKFSYFGHMPFTDYPNYLGVVVVFFAVVAGLIARTRFVWFLIVVVVLTTFVSFGKHLPILYGPLFKFLPYFNKFRVPVMVLIVQQFAVVVMFGLGLSALIKYDAARGGRAAMKIVIGAGVAVGVVLISHGFWTGGFAESIAERIRNVRSAADQLRLAGMAGEFLYKDLVKITLLTLATALLVWLFFKRRVAATAFVLIIIGLGLLDIFLVDRDIIHPEKMFNFPRLRVIHDRDSGNRILDSDPLIEFLQSREKYYRVFPMLHPSNPVVGDFETNRYMNFGISSMGGYHPAKLIIYKDFIDALDAAVKSGDFRMADMLNAKYIVTSNPLPEHPRFTPLWQGIDYNGDQRLVYENTQALDRVFFVDRYEIESGDRALGRLLADRGVDVSQTVLLDKAPAIEPQSREGASASITDYKLNEITISASLPSPALMVLSEIFYPSWQVEIDGVPGEIIRANHVLRAVALPAGDHEVVFRFDMSILKRSLAISITTLIIAFGFLGSVLVVNLRGRWKWKHS